MLELQQIRQLFGVLPIRLIYLIILLFGRMVCHSAEYRII